MRKKSTVREGPSKEMRVKIIEAATELFMSEGLYNVTLQQIAQRVQITQPGIYRHFNNMDDIILSACKHWVTRSVDAIRPEQERLNSAWEQLQSYVDRHLNYAFENRSHDGLLLGLYYYSMRSPEMLEFYQETKTHALLHLSLVLKIGSFEKTWASVDIAEMAETIHSIVVAEVIKILIEPKAKPLRIVKKRIFSHLKILLGSG